MRARVPGGKGILALEALLHEAYSAAELAERRAQECEAETARALHRGDELHAENTRLTEQVLLQHRRERKCEAHNEQLIADAVRFQQENTRLLGAAWQAAHEVERVSRCIHESMQLVKDKGPGWVEALRRKLSDALVGAGNARHRLDLPASDNSAICKLPPEGES